MVLLMVLINLATATLATPNNSKVTKLTNGSTNGAVSGLVAIDSTDVNGNTGINFEQAHFP